ncbi:hypothetical protein M1563_02930 [Patescibacteria group bacterium]|nr:hypothetical protein [Patescibacteria group bacterium]
MKKAICVDFDGVIHQYSQGWLDGSVYDKPIKGAKRSLAHIVKSGFEVIIFTTRLNSEVNSDTDQQLEKIKEWLTKYGFREQQHYHRITAIKPQATAYIDDHGVEFTSWREVLAKIS